jgi:hypothetical protein
MAPLHRRKQSLNTALRNVRGLIKKSAETDFTTKSEDVAVSTLYAAVTTMHGFLQELSRHKSICDCADRSWHGEGHDTECNVERIAYLLGEIGSIPARSYYVVFIEGDVEPNLHGPFSTEETRDKKARQLRRDDRDDLKSARQRRRLTRTPVDFSRTKTMAIRLTLEMPESALKRLIDGYRAGDPVLMAILKEFRGVAINPHDEFSHAQWENEGGSVVSDPT